MRLVDVEVDGIGLIRRRDAIQVARIESINPRIIKIIGNIASNLFSEAKVKGFFNVEFIFDGVIMLKYLFDEIRELMSDEEFDIYAYSDSESAIEEIENSRIVKMNKEIRGLENIRHFIVTAHDYRIEIVCTGFAALMK